MKLSKLLLLLVLVRSALFFPCSGAESSPIDISDVAISQRMEAAWNAHRGRAYENKPVQPPAFKGRPRIAREYARAIGDYALRVFHNGEQEGYQLANAKIIEHCKFFDRNKDVRNDRDSFYWHIGEFCHAILHYGTKGDRQPALVSPAAEQAFAEMAFSYCHDLSKRKDADPTKTWHVYESENHHVQRASAFWQLLRVLRHLDSATWSSRKLADGGTVEEHYRAWTEFFQAWMRERAKRSMFIEINSRCYGSHTMKNLYPLHDFAETPELRRLTRDFLDLFWALWAQEQLNGALGGGMSRVYPAVARSTANESSRWASWYFGIGKAAKPVGSDYVCIDSSYRPAPIIRRLATEPERRGVYEIESRPLGWALPGDRWPNYLPATDWGRIYRYTWATPDYILGTVMCPEVKKERWCLISSQNRFQGVVYAAAADAQLLPIPMPTIMHTVGATVPSVSYDAMWAIQRKGTLVTRRNRNSRSAGDMCVWFSAAGGVAANAVVEGDWVFTRCGGAYTAVRVAIGGSRFVEAGKGKAQECEKEGRFLFCNDRKSPVIVETARACDYASEAAFRARVQSLECRVTEAALDYTGLSGNRFHMALDGKGASTIDGEPYVKKIDWSFRSPFVTSRWLSGKVDIHFAGQSLSLDFQ